MKNFPADIMRSFHLGPIVGVDVTRGRSIVADDIRSESVWRWILSGQWRRGPPIVSLLMRAATVSSGRDLTASRLASDLLVTPSLERVEIVRTGPRFATSQSALRPPYPASKLDSEEEAALKLHLAIDERGRVVAVDPVGPADPAFLASARRHLLARWRYQPATENGRPVRSSTVITLRFELE